MTRLLLALPFALLAIACAPPEPEPPEGPSCGDVSRAICGAACDCLEGEECGIASAEGGFSLTFDSEADCRTLFAFGCLPEEQRQPCIDAVAEAECVEGGVVEQQECVPEEEGDAGP